jgi:hypothetical protein
MIRVCFSKCEAGNVQNADRRISRKAEGKTRLLLAGETRCRSSRATDTSIRFQSPASSSRFAPHWISGRTRSFRLSTVSPCVSGSPTISSERKQSSLGWIIALRRGGEPNERGVPQQVAGTNQLSLSNVFALLRKQGLRSGEESPRL